MNQNEFWTLLAKKLAGEANEEELAQIEELLQQHPELVYSAEKLQDIWIMEPKKSQPFSEDSFLEHLAYMEQQGVDITSWKEEKVIAAPKVQPMRKLIYMAFAASVIGIAVFLFLYKPFVNPHKSSFSEVSTRLGSKSKLVLPDGSVVWLNAGSKLTYDKNFGNGNRSVTLNGEAFFDVVKMPDLPFVIQTKAIQIKVLGTAFNVRSYEDEPTTQTSLIRGKVQITINKRPDEVFFLKPNQKLVVANEPAAANKTEEKHIDKKIPLVSLEQLTYVPRDSSIVETSWKENKLVFQDESFYELAKKLEKWYDVKLSFSDPEIETIRLSGTFEKETITQALEALQITADFHFTINQNNIIITK